MDFLVIATEREISWAAYHSPPGPLSPAKNAGKRGKQDRRRKEKRKDGLRRGRAGYRRSQKTQGGTPNHGLG